MHLHARTELWTRDEEGHYHAELSGWALVVKWQPEAGGTRGFWYEATRNDAGGGAPLRSALFEEIEHAMAHAERVAMGAAS